MSRRPRAARRRARSRGRPRRASSRPVICDGLPFVQPRVDAREALAEGLQPLGHAERDRRRHEPHVQRARLAAPDPRRLVDALLRRGQQPPRPLQERRARRRQRDRPRRARQQRRADDRLQPPDLLRERRLGHVQPPRRAAEVQLLGDRDEVAQVAQLQSGIHTADGYRSPTIQILDISTAAGRTILARDRDDHHRLASPPPRTPPRSRASTRSGSTTHFTLEAKDRETLADPFGAYVAPGRRRAARPSRRRHGPGLRRAGARRAGRRRRLRAVQDGRGARRPGPWPRPPPAARRRSSAPARWARPRSSWAPRRSWRRPSTSTRRSASRHVPREDIGPMPYDRANVFMSSGALRARAAPAALPAGRRAAASRCRCARPGRGA